MLVALDTGNQPRVGDDSIIGTWKLAAYVAATHAQDPALNPSSSPASPNYLCTPIGKAFVDLRREVTCSSVVSSSRNLARP